MKYKKVLGLAFTYTGAVIGAGFFSGNEIWRFFGRNGIYGLYGILISGMFFIVIAFLFFNKLNQCDSDNYNTLFYSKNLSLGVFFDVVYSFFLWVSCTVMCAGMVSILNNYFNLNTYLSIIIISSFILIILCHRLDGIYNINIILIPLLVIISIYTLILFIPQISKTYFHALFFDFLEVNKIAKLRGITDAFLYGGYNLALVLGVMIGIVGNFNRNEIFLSTIIGGFILVLLNFLIYIGLKTAFYKKPVMEIPMLVLAKNNNVLSFYSYVFALFAAMFSTVTANCYTLTKRIEKLGLRYNIALIVLLTSFFLLSKLGFSYLIDLFYPISGFFGLLLLMYVSYILFVEK